MDRIAAKRDSGTVPYRRDRGRHRDSLSFMRSPNQRSATQVIVMIRSWSTLVPKLEPGAPMYPARSIVPI